MNDVRRPSSPEQEAELFRLLVENVKDYAIFLIDLEGRVRSWNDGAARLLGYQEAEILGQPFELFFTPEDCRNEAPMKELAQARTEGRSDDDRWHMRKDGSRFWAGGTLTPLWDDDRRLRGYAKIMRDRTEWKTATDERDSLSARFRSLMEQAPFSIQVFSADGRTVRVNRAWEALWGLRFDQIKDYNILEDRQLEAKGVLSFITRAFAGEASRVPAIEYNPQETIPQGEWLEDPRRFLSAVIYPIKDGEGTIQEVILVHEDITAHKLAEEKLLRSEKQARSILESITQAFCSFDREWRFSYVNREAEVLLGRTREELIGKNHWEEFPDAVGTVLELTYRQAMDQQQSVSLEVFYEPHNRWYDTQVYPSADGLSVYFRDVSERKRAEEALRESEHKFRQLADAMPQIVWTAAPDGNIDYLNRRWTEFTGFPPTVGNEAWSELLHPHDSAIAAQRWADSLEASAPYEMEIRLLDRREQHYRWHLIRTVPVCDEAGNVLRWYGTSTDIHEQKQAEEAARFLSKASAALAHVIDTESTLQKVANLAVPYFADWAAVDIATSDGALRRTAVAHENGEKISLVREIMREYPSDPDMPGGAYAVLRSGTPEMVAEITDDMLARGAKDDRHLAVLRSLGLRSYMCVPLIVSGKPFGVLTFATAESKRRYTELELALAMDLANRAAIAIENTQLYQSLREADRRKDEFLATLAHELRNPLAPIRNSLQILKMPHLDAETIERSRETMERQVHQLVRLVDDLLDVSRVMRGKIDLRRERVELATVIARAVETVQPLIESHAHDLDVSVCAESLLVDADPIRLAQVIGNLVTNAAKYTDPGGRIWIVADKREDEAVITVRDTGIGIAPEQLSRIFDLFVQVDHASTKAQGGLGIGLTLVKNLVEMHNGQIEVHSEGLGKGSEFVLRLPLMTGAIRNDAEAAATPAPPIRPSGTRLLVVDDNHDAATSLATWLKLQGHDVRVAFSGLAALDIARSYIPHAVFLDIGMPGMDGHEVARRLRALPGLEGVVLAALTGWGQQEDRRKSAESGFNHHLVKPPDPQTLERIVSDLGSELRA